MVSFAVQKLLSLIRSHLFIFPFISITPGDRSKKNLLKTNKQTNKKELAVIYVKECPAYVFLLDFYNIQSYI